MTSRFFGRYLTPSSHSVIKVTPPSNMTPQAFPPTKKRKNFPVKINMFIIIFIVVRVKGENNYIRRRPNGGAQKPRTPHFFSIIHSEIVCADLHNNSVLLSIFLLNLLFTKQRQNQHSAAADSSQHAH